MNALAEVGSSSFVHIESWVWNIREPEIRFGLFEDKFVSLSGDARITLRVEHEGVVHRADVHGGFRCVIDPKNPIANGEFDFVDVQADAFLSFSDQQCSWNDAPDDVGHVAGLIDFCKMMLKIAGPSILSALDELMQLPRTLLTHMREVLREQIIEYVPDILDLQNSMLQALDDGIRYATVLLDTSLDYAYRAAALGSHALLTSLEFISDVGPDVYRKTLRGVQILYAAALGDPEELYTIVVESVTSMAKSIESAADAFGQAFVAIWEDCLHAANLAVEQAKNQIRDLFAKAVAAIIEVEGWAIDKVKKCTFALHDALAQMGGNSPLPASDDGLADWLGALCGHLASYLAAHIQIGFETLCDWLSELGELLIEGWITYCKIQFIATYRLLRFVLKVLFWTLRALYALVSGDEDQRAICRHKLIEPWLRPCIAFCDGAIKMAADEFGKLLALAAEFERELLEALTDLLLEARDLLAALIGEAWMAEVVAALEAIRDYMKQVADAIATGLRYFQRAAIGLVQTVKDAVQDVVDAVQELLVIWKARITEIARTLWEYALAAATGLIKYHPLFVFFRAYFKLLGELMSLVVEKITPYVQDGVEFAKEVFAKIEAQLAEWRDSLMELMGYVDPGATYEFALQTVAVGDARTSRRSQSSIEVVEPIADENMVKGASVLYPVLRALGVGDEGLGVLWIGAYTGRRYYTPHPATMMVGPAAHEDPEAQRKPDKEWLFACPIRGEGDFRAALLVNPVCYAVDPRYSWGYGASLQFKYADIDGDGRVEQWEVEKKLIEDNSGDLNADGVADALDVQLMLEQADNVLHGVPYRQLSTPLGLRTRWGDGSWCFATIASISDEGIGMRDKAEQSPDAKSLDPDAPERSLKSVGPGGTTQPEDMALRRTGVGFFLQGQIDPVRFFNPEAKTGYPVTFHCESREFIDVLDSGLMNSGHSDFLILRGGEGGNDFQARLFSYINPWRTMIPPVLTFTPTLQLTFALRLGLGGGAAGEGGMRVGLRYASKSPIAEIAHLHANPDASSKSKKKAETWEKIQNDPVGEALKRINEHYGFKDLLPNIRRAMVPLLSLFLYDEEFEATAALVQSIMVGDGVALEVRMNWASRDKSRRQLLEMLQRAHELHGYWNAASEARNEAQKLLHEYWESDAMEIHDPAVKERLETDLRTIWENLSTTEPASPETITALRRAQELQIRFMRDFIDKKMEGKKLQEKFDEAWAKKSESQRVEAFNDWLAGQKIEYYLLEVCGKYITQIDKRLEKADFAGAVHVLSRAVENFDSDPGAQAAALSEAMLAIVVLMESFGKMTKVFQFLHNAKDKLPKGKNAGSQKNPHAESPDSAKEGSGGGLTDLAKKHRDNLAKKLQEERDKRTSAHEKLLAARKQAADEKSEPPDAVAALKEHSKFGKAFAETNRHVEDAYWAHDFLEEGLNTPENAKSLGSDDTISLVWGADFAAGVGLGGQTMGTGASASLVGGIKFSAPSIKWTAKLFEGIPNKLKLSRFVLRVVRHVVAVYLHWDEDASISHRLDSDGAVRVTIDTGIQLLIALIDALRDTMHPETGDAEWAESLASGLVFSTGIAGVIKGGVTGGPAGVSLRAGAELTISTSLASLLDPVITVLQRGMPQGVDKALLFDRLVPKISLECQQSAQLVANVGTVELGLGATAKAMEGDFMLPDGSPWRVALEKEIEEIIESIDRYRRVGRNDAQVATQDGGPLDGFTTLMDTLDTMFKRQIDYIEADSKKKNSEKKGVGGLLTDPMAREALLRLVDPDLDKNAKDARREELDNALRGFSRAKHGAVEFPGTPGIRVKVTPQSNKREYAASVLVHADDADHFGKKTELTRTGWERFDLVWKIDPVPVDVRFNRYVKKDKSSLNGIIIGYPTKAKARAFLDARPDDWVSEELRGVQPWASPHVGNSGRGEWYVWATTKIHELIAKYRDAKKKVPLPRLLVDKVGLRLRFALVEDDIVKDEDLSGFPVTRERAEELCEIEVLTRASLRDINALRHAAHGSASGDSDGSDASEGDDSDKIPDSDQDDPQDSDTEDKSGSDSSDKEESSDSQDDGDADPKNDTDNESDDTDTGSDDSSDLLPYRVLRMQRALNFAIRQRRLQAITVRLVMDGHFGPKTNAAARAWAASENIVGDHARLEGSPGDEVVRLAKGLADSIEALRLERDASTSDSNVDTQGLVALASVKAQSAINRSLAAGELTAWRERLWQDGRFGPKTKAALESLAKEKIGGSPQHGRWVDGETGAGACHADPTLSAYILQTLDRLSSTSQSDPAKPDEQDVDPDDKGTEEGDSLYMGWGRIPVLVKSTKDATQGAIRADFASALGDIHAQLQAVGSGISGGGYRSPNAKVSAGRSATSLHMLGRAWDLHLGMGLHDPAKDNYVIVPEGERWRVYARVRQGNGGTWHRLEAVRYEYVKSIQRASWGTYRLEFVEGNFIDLTALFKSIGFVPIRPRKKWRQPTDGLRQWLSCEWWHFETHVGLVVGESTFGDELLHAFRYSTLKQTDVWNASRNKRWKGGVFG